MADLLEAKMESNPFEPEIVHLCDPNLEQRSMTSKYYFTLDDIPYCNWLKRLQEFYA